MALVRWRPYREMLTLRDAMDRLWADALARPSSGWPERTETGLFVALDMRETDEDVVVEAELPGVKPEDVDISVTDSTLTVKGEFKSEKEEERGDVHIRERSYGAFHRAVRLPTAIEADDAKAEFADGVLTITLPKSEATKPKQITVEAKA